MLNWKKVINVMIIITFIISIYFLCHQVNQKEFVPVFICYTLAFSCYLLILRNNEQYNKQNKLTLYTVLFISLLIAMVGHPKLSDDIYRFIWDGELMYRGISPYTLLPNEVIKVKNEQPFISLYNELNSPTYYSIYPFTCQLIFLKAVILSKLGIDVGIALKLIYTIIHLIGLRFVLRLCNENNVSETNAYYFYLNPLVIVEGIGNLHAEVVMVALFAMAIYYLKREKWLLSALLYSLSIATKLTTLLLLPYLFFKFYKEKKYRFFMYLIPFCLLLFLPIVFDKGLHGFMNSLDLYFRKFEFNASIYYLLREMGQWMTGYNQIAIIGPLLGLVFIFFTTKWSYLKSKFEVNIINLSTLALMIFPLHLLLSTTVHPWYLITPLFFTIFQKNNAILIWSYCITWTYYHYNGSSYKENMWIIAAEYLIVFAIYLVNQNFINRFSKNQS